jgi:hypothetical protein
MAIDHWNNLCWSISRIDHCSSQFFSNNLLIRPGRR